MYKFWYIVFKKYSTTGDGLFAALKVIEAMKFYDRPLAELVNQIELFPQKLVNVKVKEKKPFDTIEKIQKEIKRCEDELKDTGRVLLRYSGTESLARVMVEGKDEQHVMNLCDELAGVVQQSLG